MHNIFILRYLTTDSSRIFHYEIRRRSFKMFAQKFWFNWHHVVWWPSQFLNKTLKLNWPNRTILKVLNGQFSFMPEKKKRKRRKKEGFFYYNYYYIFIIIINAYYLFVWLRVIYEYPVLSEIGRYYLYFKGPILRGKINFRWSVLQDLFKFDLSFFSLRNV